MTRIETSRLVLRPLRADDRSWLASLHLDAGGVADDADRELDEALAHEQRHGFGHFVAELRDSGERVGIVELHLAGEGLVGIDPDEVEIGWIVGRDHRGAGLATEAARATAAHALDTLRLGQVVAYVRPENRASRRVVEKVGMRRRGAGRSRSGAPVDVFELARHGPGTPA